MTLQNTFDEFLITQQIKGNSQKTVAYYRNCVSPMISYIGADMDIHLLNAEILRKYALFLRRRGICDNSYKTYIKGIKAYLHWLFEEDYTTLNFSDKLKLPKAQRKLLIFSILPRLNSFSHVSTQRIFKGFGIIVFVRLCLIAVCAVVKLFV